MLKKLTAYVLALIMLASALFGSIATIQAAPTDTAVSLFNYDFEDDSL